MNEKERALAGGPQALALYPSFGTHPHTNADLSAISTGESYTSVSTK